MAATSLPRRASPGPWRGTPAPGCLSAGEGVPPAGFPRRRRGGSGKVGIVEIHPAGIPGEAHPPVGFFRQGVVVSSSPAAKVRMASFSRRPQSLCHLPGWRSFPSPAKRLNSSCQARRVSRISSSHPGGWAIFPRFRRFNSFLATFLPSPIAHQPHVQGEGEGDMGGALVHLDEGGILGVLGLPPVVPASSPASVWAKGPAAAGEPNASLTLVQRGWSPGTRPGAGGCG